MGLKFLDSLKQAKDKTYVHERACGVRASRTNTGRGRPIAVHFMTLPDKVSACPSFVCLDKPLTVLCAGRPTGLLRVHEAATGVGHYRGMQSDFPAVRSHPHGHFLHDSSAQQSSLDHKRQPSNCSNSRRNSHITKPSTVRI